MNAILRQVLPLCSAVLVFAAPVGSQVIPQPPPNVLYSIDCGSAFGVVPHNLFVQYRVVNARAGGGDGQLRLTYYASHVNETPSSGSRARYLSRDVDVQELFSDMGTWMMRENSGKKRWWGRCVRARSFFGERSYVYADDIQGNVTQIEPPDDPSCPTGTTPEPGGGCSSRAPAPPGGGSSGGGGLPPHVGCTWYEYTYWNWANGVWRPLRRWYVCE